MDLLLPQQRCGNGAICLRSQGYSRAVRSRWYSLVSAYLNFDPEVEHGNYEHIGLLRGGSLVSYFLSVHLIHPTGPLGHEVHSREDVISLNWLLTDNSGCFPWLLCSFIILIKLVICHRKMVITRNLGEHIFCSTWF